MKSLVSLRSASVVIVALCLAQVAAAAITAADSVVARRFVARFHPYDTYGMNYELFVPAVQAGHRYPLIIGLHGYGDGDTVTSPIYRHPMATVWARDTTQAKHPCFVVAPQCSFGWRWVNWDWTLGNYSIDSIPVSLAIECVVSIIDSLKRQYPIDTTRIYVTGYSMGGFGAWDLVTRYPTRFAASITMCSAGDTTKASLLRPLSVWDFHSENDSTVPVSGSRRMIAALVATGRQVNCTDCDAASNCSHPLPQTRVDSIINAGAALLYTEYQFAGHSCVDSAGHGYDNPEIVPWLFRQQRSGGASVAGGFRAAAPATASAAIRAARCLVDRRGVRVLGPSGYYDLRGEFVKLR